MGNRTGSSPVLRTTEKVVIDGGFLFYHAKKIAFRRTAAHVRLSTPKKDESGKRDCCHVAWWVSRRRETASFGCFVMFLNEERMFDEWNQ